MGVNMAAFVRYDVREGKKNAVIPLVLVGLVITLVFVAAADCAGFFRTHSNQNRLHSGWRAVGDSRGSGLRRSAGLHDFVSSSGRI